MLDAGSIKYCPLVGAGRVDQTEFLNRSDRMHLIALVALGCFKKCRYGFLHFKNAMFAVSSKRGRIINVRLELGIQSEGMTKYVG